MLSAGRTRKSDQDVENLKAWEEMERNKLSAEKDGIYESK